MTERTTRVFAPKAPHPDSLADPELTIGDADLSVMIHYDPRNRVGGIYYVELQNWSLHSPINFAGFIDHVQRTGLRIPDGADLQRWLDRIEAVTLESGHHGVAN
jgi:hypothetical protein